MAALTPLTIKPTRLGLPNLAFPWAEFTGDEGSETSSLRNHGTQAATFRMEIPGAWYTNGPKRFGVPKNAWDQVVGQLLGHSRKGEGDKIDRVTPFPHPRTPRLYCEEIADVKPIGYLRQNSKRYGYSDWERVVLTLRFASRPYQVMTNQETTGSESDRYVEELPAQPRTDFITLRNGSFKWDDPAYAPANPDVDASIGIRITKTKITRIWHQVPERFVLDATGFPTKIQMCVGKVNNAAFLGQPAETVLCEAPDIVPEEAPVALSRFDSGPVSRRGRKSPYYMRVTLNFLHFAPTTTSTVAKGFNLYPTPGNQWFRIRAAKAATPGVLDTLQYEQADFENLWKSAT